MNKVKLHAARAGIGRRSVKMPVAGFALVAILALPACINISAPEEPIVIELNVNIEARLLVELAEDASNTIDENADIF